MGSRGGICEDLRVGMTSELTGAEGSLELRDRGGQWWEAGREG